MPAPTPHCLPRLSPSGRLHNSAPSHLEAQWTPAPPSSCRAVRAPHMAASRGVLRAAPRAHAPAGAPAVHCLLTSTPGSGSFARREQISGLRTGHSFRCRPTAGPAKCTDQGGQAPGSGNHSRSAAPASAHVALSYGGRGMPGYRGARAPASGTNAGGGGTVRSSRPRLRPRGCPIQALRT